MSRLLCHLSYTAAPRLKIRAQRARINEPGWSPLTESNRRPSPYHGDALPTELRGRAEERVHGPPGSEKTDPLPADPPAGRPRRSGREQLEPPPPYAGLAGTHRRAGGQPGVEPVGIERAADQ